MIEDVATFIWHKTNVYIAKNLSVFKKSKLLFNILLKSEILCGIITLYFFPNFFGGVNKQRNEGKLCGKNLDTN